MKQIKFLLLFAIMAFVLSPIVDASVIQPVTQFVQNISPVDAGVSLATLAVIPAIPLAVYVKENCTIPVPELAELASKYGKIKILTVVVEPPVYGPGGELTDKGEFYSYAVRRPDSSMVRMLVDYAEKGENQKYIDAAIKNLIVGGDIDRIQTDGVVYMGITAQLKDVLRPYESFLEKA